MALSDKINLYPQQHAWLLLDNEVIEPTANGLSPCYFGVPFNRQWVIEKTQEKQASNDPKINFLNYESPLSIELLKYGLPPAAL